MPAILTKPTSEQRTSAIYFVVNRMALEIRSLSRTNDPSAFPKIQELSDTIAFLVRDCGVNLSMSDDSLCEMLLETSKRASKFNWKEIYMSHLVNGE